MGKLHYLVISHSTWMTPVSKYRLTAFDDSVLILKQWKAKGRGG